MGKKFWVSTVGQQQTGERFKPEKHNFDVLSYGDDGQLMLPAYVQSLKPKAVIIQDDLFTMVKDGLHNMDWTKTKLVLYAAIDGEVVGTGCDKILDVADGIVAMNEFGRDVLENEGYHVDRVIYHGTSPETFYPVPEPQKQYIRETVEAFIEQNTNQEGVELANKFLVYGLGRNIMRKNWFDTLRAFAIFAEGKDDVRFLVNSINYQDPQNNMLDWINRAFLAQKFTSENLLENGKTIFFPSLSYSRGVPDGMMGDLARMPDYYMTLAFGEGMGMPILESLFCDVPVISHEFSTPKYLLKNGKGLLVGSDHYLTGNYGIGHDLPNIKEAVKALEKAYATWKQANKWEVFNQESFEDFRQKYTWEKMSREWEDLINEL